MMTVNEITLDENGFATEAGFITVYNYNGETREYISSSLEFLPFGVGVPAHSTTEAPGESKAGFAIRRTADLTGWELAPDHRGETVYSTTNGKPVTVSQLGEYPEGTTVKAPSTQYDKWDGKKWVTDSDEQHRAAVEAAEAQRQSLIDAAMASISLIQLKLQAGRKLTQPENTRLNAVLDYIDAVTATDTSTAPDVIWPELPEA